MNTVSLIGSVSRLSGGLFESVRRLHQELFKNSETLEFRDTDNEGERNRSINVRVLGLRDEFTEQDLGAWHPVPVQSFTIRGSRGFGYASGMSRTLMGAKPDLVHVHGLWHYNSLLTSQWHRKSRKPYLVSPHGMLDPWALKNSAWKKKPAWFAYERRHLREAGCIRALCQSEADSIRALGLGNPICLIPNGVDIPEGNFRTRPADMEASGVPSRAKILLYLGRIHPKKGLAALLTAWARAERPSEWILLVMGWDQGGHEAELKHLAADLGLVWTDPRDEQRTGASVVFTGPRFGANKREWLQRCDAMILPSLSEGLPMAILEAWANAKPALVTPQCNLPEGVAAGAAFAIDADPDVIAAGLERLFRADVTVLKTMGARGRELVMQKFAWPKLVTDLRAVYGWLTDAAPKPECVISLEALQYGSRP